MPAASLTTALRRLSPRRWVNFQAALPAVPRRHGLLIGSAARTRRLQRQRRPASCRFRRGTRAHSGPARPRHARRWSWIPSAERRIGPQALRSDSWHPLNAGGITDYGPATAPSAPPGWVNFQAALPAVPRRHGLLIGSAARTRRLQRQRRPASCRFRRGTRAHSGPARPRHARAGGPGYPSAERRIGPQALRSDSRHPLNAGGITD